MSEDRDRYLIGLIEGRSGETEILGELSNAQRRGMMLRRAVPPRQTPGKPSGDFATAPVPARSDGTPQNRDRPSSETGRSGYSPDLKEQSLYMLQLALDAQARTNALLGKLQSHVLMTHASFQQQCEDIMAELTGSAQYAVQAGAYYPRPAGSGGGSSLAPYYANALGKVSTLSGSANIDAAAEAAAAVNVLVLSIQRTIQVAQQVAQQQQRRAVSATKKPGLWKKLFG